MRLAPGTVSAAARAAGQDDLVGGVELEQGGRGVAPDAAGSDDQVTGHEMGSSDSRRCIADENSVHGPDQPCQERCSRTWTPVTRTGRLVVVTAPGLRERNRRDLTAALLDAGRQQLGEVGAAALSLRGVAREVGMVPSAVYRYFPSRDHLMTALLLEAYTGLADALEAAEASVRASDVAARWRVAVPRGPRPGRLRTRTSGRLLYGSPVPGYGAPADTVRQVERMTATFGRVLAEVGAGERPPSGPRRLTPLLREDLAALKASPIFAGADGTPAAVPDLALVRGLGAWVQVFGLVSFEQFGQFENVVRDRDAFFAAQVEILWRTLAGV